MGSASLWWLAVSCYLGVAVVAFILILAHPASYPLLLWSVVPIGCLAATAIVSVPIVVARLKIKTFRMNAATLSPEGILLKGWFWSFFYPWASVKGIRRRKDVFRFEGRTYSFWRLSVVDVKAGSKVLDVFEHTAVAILKYPSCPRLQLTDADLEIARRLEVPLRIR